MTFTKDQTYWLTHPDHGTVKARAVVVSSNQKSLGFSTDRTLCFRSKTGGFAVGPAIMITQDDGKLTDVLTGSEWKAFESEPERGSA